MTGIIIAYILIEKQAFRYHHERCDGRGYPGGITGEEIPLESRMLAAADSFDAMISDRSYRKGIGFKKAVKELSENRGIQFDPEVVDAFVDMDHAGFEKRKTEK